MTRQRNTQEYDGSLNDFIDRVRSEFGKQFPGVAGDYPWVTDVFNDSVIVRSGDQYYRVRMTVTDEAIIFAKRLEWELVRLSYVAETLTRQRLSDVMLVWEFKGKYPDVPIATGVDYDALVEGDSDPVFVTLPIGKANVKSGNKRFYDDKFVAELERQVLANKPVGLMGHLSAEARATEFPSEAVHWVGARRVGELLWGKGYVPPGDARARLKRYRASGKKIATSIDAMLEGIWDDDVQAYRMKADTLRLYQIDIAPADRAGIADLAAVPHFTTEMSGSGNYQEDYMDKLQAIRELTADDAQLLPAAVRNAVLGAATPAPEVAQVAEIRKALGLDDKADPVQAVTELCRQHAEQEKQAVTTKITELVSAGIQIETLRPLVQELVTARNPQTVQEAETVTKQVLESEAVKGLLAGHVRETMGPAQTKPVQGQNGKGGKAGRYFSIPAKED